MTLSDAPIDRVVTFKLLGVNVANDLKWNTLIEAISRKVASRSRLYFLKQLKRAGAGLNDLLNFYCSVIRPVLEYASPRKHSSPEYQRIRMKITDVIKMHAFANISGNFPKIPTNSQPN